MVEHVQPHKRTLDPNWLTNSSQYFRRGWHSSIALGDYIYIDGGDVNWRNDNGAVLETAVNSTYSIPISESWTPSNVSLRRIDKGSSPPRNRENMWPDVSNQVIFAYNGDLSSAIQLNNQDQPTSSQLWKFTPDGQGGGAWSLVGVADNLIQSTAAAATTANGSAYVLGGLEVPTSSNTISTGYIASANGLVTYDMTAQIWENQTMNGFAPTGWSQAAQLYHLTGIGNSQLLLAMGGTTSVPGAKQGAKTDVPYSTVSIYNTQTQEWHNQSTTGDIPDGRNSACDVGIQGDDKTYEIFIHGGAETSLGQIATQSQQNINLDQVYVLSIPSFTWHKSSYSPADARAAHTCQVAGNRQMIAYGGIQPSLFIRDVTIDPWPQGIGIFDLTEMAWKDSYDAGASPYSTPQQIKDYITANGSYPQKWDSSVVEEWMTGQTVNTSSPSPSPSSSSSQPNTKSNTGAIVGGVVGGLVGLILIAIVAWFLLRRRSKKKQPVAQPPKEFGMYNKAEMDAKHELLIKPHEAAASSTGHELPAYDEQKGLRSELP